MIRRVVNFSNINTYKYLTVIRNYAPRRRQEKLPDNPGLDKRLKHFKEDIKYFEDDPEMFDSIEPDFMNLDKAYDMHKEELAKMKDIKSKLIIRRKYFKTNTPNFLMFNEKEQIRDLHERDPDEWTIDKLSQSFPADPYTISLILRAKWQPKDVRRITRHDQSVLKNWNEFKKGNIEIDPILAEHLKKFASRDFNALMQQPQNRKLSIEIPKPRKTEFLRIITSCNKKRDLDDRTTQRAKKITSEETRIPEERPHVDADTFLLSGRKDLPNQEITLSELQKKNPQLKIKEQIPAELAKFDETPNFKASKFKNDKSELSNYVKDTEKVLESLEIQRKIKIPKKLYEKGKIYQVEDCFYADDGDFLYRVPGFFSKQ